MSSWPPVTHQDVQDAVSTLRGSVPPVLTGATAATRYVGGTVSGAPTSGTFAVGDFVIDQTAAIWICTVAGSPGTWKQAGSAAYQSVIAEQVLTGATASVTFSSIPQTYRHLRLVISGRSDRAADTEQLRATLNGDTGANYDYSELFHEGSVITAAQAFAGTFIIVGYLAGATSPASSAGQVDLLIANYVGTTFHKHFTARSDFVRSASTRRASMHSGRWANTAAVTSLTVNGIGNLIAGSVLTLYGVKGT